MKNIWLINLLGILHRDYLNNILLNYNNPKVGPDLKLREKLQEYKLDKLIQILKDLDKSTYNSEFHITKRRIISSIDSFF